MLLAQDGQLVLFLGNINAFAPHTQAAWEAIRDGRLVPAFQRESRSVTGPLAADFVVVGNFNRDTRLDAVVAARGGDRLYLPRRRWREKFPKIREIEVNGSITALQSADANDADGLPDVIVATSGTDGFRLRIFASLGDMFANARMDVSLNGVLNGSDLSMTKAASGTVIP